MSLLPVNFQLLALDKPLDIIILCGFFWGAVKTMAESAPDFFLQTGT